MRLISRTKLVEFWTRYTDSKEQLQAWATEVKHAEWRTPSDVKARYSTADILPGDRVVFNIKGKKYRLIVKIQYNIQIVFIRFIGTHKEYDRIDAEKI
ncbi:MAG: type II toxin-antitoxin system HigB family toxin [Anaerolineales bacterium]|nr:MAG: type II toxin-antitoxin system HigB family toxin [Anaerolineales bacterium]